MAHGATPASCHQASNGLPTGGRTAAEEQVIILLTGSAEVRQALAGLTSWSDMTGGCLRGSASRGLDPDIV